MIVGCDLVDDRNGGVQRRTAPPAVGETLRRDHENRLQREMVVVEQAHRAVRVVVELRLVCRCRVRRRRAGTGSADRPATRRSRAARNSGTAARCRRCCWCRRGTDRALPPSRLQQAAGRRSAVPDVCRTTSLSPGVSEAATLARADDAFRQAVDASGLANAPGIGQPLPIPIPHSPFPIPHSPFPIPHSP